MPPSTRSFQMTYTFNPGTVPSLAARIMPLWRKNGEVLLGKVVDAIIEDAQARLFKPSNFPEEKHGFDSGLLHDSLVKVFMEMITDGVFYELKSYLAYYWMWVNFGHFTTSGNWWEGYHFFEDAIEMHGPEIAIAARESWTLAAREAAVSAGITPGSRGGGHGAILMAIESGVG